MMDHTVLAIAAVLGALFGAVVIWLTLRDALGSIKQRLGTAETEKATLEERVRGLQTTVIDLQAQKCHLEQDAKLAAESALSLKGELAASNAELALHRTELTEKNTQIERLTDKVTAAQDGCGQLRTRIAELEAVLQQERRSAEEKLAILNEAKAVLSNTFKALSLDALRSNNDAFLQLAKSALGEFQEGSRRDLSERQEAIKNLLKPVEDTLGRLEQNVGDIELKREGAYQSVNFQVEELKKGQELLRKEAENLVRALRTPQVRGRWGEIQLRKVVELAGMLEHCDFEEQSTINAEDGSFRPDMVVRLPNGKNVIVDAKAPLESYLNANDIEDEEQRRSKLQAHARCIRDHAKQLGQKAYHEKFQPSPEFVVLFLPGEPIFSAALQHDSSLIEHCVGEKVILATPTTLISLLKAVAYGWRQEHLAANAREISELGRELYDRVAKLSDHFSALGKDLQGAVKHYNDASKTIESRVLVTARKFKQLKAAEAAPEIKTLVPIEVLAREPQFAA